MVSKLFNMLSSFAILAFITIQVTLPSIEATSDTPTNTTARKNCAENKSLPICKSNDGDETSYLACHSELKFDFFYKIKGYSRDDLQKKPESASLIKDIKNLSVYLECHVDGEYSCKSSENTLKCDAPGTDPFSTRTTDKILFGLIVVLVLWVLLFCISKNSTRISSACSGIKERLFAACSGIKERLCECKVLIFERLF